LKEAQSMRDAQKQVYIAAKSKLDQLGEFHEFLSDYFFILNSRKAHYNHKLHNKKAIRFAYRIVFKRQKN
jgi:hypothetical protein